MAFLLPLTAVEGREGLSRTGLVLDVRYKAHDTGPGHPERAERLDAIEEGLRQDGLLEQIVRVEPRVCKDRRILLAHDQEYLGIVTNAHAKAMRRLPTGDTAFSAKSLETARLATGGVLEACDRVMAKDVDTVFCAVRPPGHHATRDRGMGFCVFNHVAIAAKYLQEHHGLERILIVDWDVHHGNGTYEILKDDPKVFQFHLQQRGIYPGTGNENEIGEGAGKGKTINVPLPPGAGRDAFLAAFEEKLLPAMKEFRPQFVLVSAGFDAHADDLLGGLRLQSEDYGDLTRQLLRLADEFAGGRMVSVLEGGYNLEALSASVSSHLRACIEHSESKRRSVAE